MISTFSVPLLILITVYTTCSQNNSIVQWILGIESAPFFIPSTSLCSLSSWFTSSCALSPNHSHHLRSHHLSLPRPFTPDLKIIHGRRIHRSWGVISPHFFTLWGQGYTVGSRGYINSLQLFNSTTCLQSCNVVFPALRHSTAIITLAVAYAYIETRQLWGDCGLH